MSEKPILTNREIKLLSMAIQSSKDPNSLQVDYKKLMELSGLGSVGSASASWGQVKKKLMSAGDPSATDGDESSAKATLTKTKAAPKKRAPAKPKAKVGAEAEVEPEADGENGAGADDEQTPTNTPRKKGGAKRKAPGPAPGPSSPIKAEDNADAATEDVTHGEDAVTDGTPAKKKRVHNRKPKDPNAPASKPRAKKGAKATASTAVNDDDNTDAANAQLSEKSESEIEAEGHVSMFGDGSIKVEGPNELTEEEQYLAQKAIDELTFGVYNGIADGDEAAV